jgi:death-on-curing protein
LARAPNLDAYAEPDASSLAAAYAAGIAKNHPFVDGNKRTAWVAARLFLDRNDVRIAFQKEDAITVMFQLAAGDISEEEFAAWLRERVRPC